MAKDDITYLGNLALGNYELMAIGRTKSEVKRTLKKEYDRLKAEYKPVDDFGKPRSFANYAEYSGLAIFEFRYGKAEWL